MNVGDSCVEEFRHSTRSPDLVDHYVLHVEGVDRHPVNLVLVGGGGATVFDAKACSQFDRRPSASGCGLLDPIQLHVLHVELVL